MLLAILYRFLYKPVLKLLHERTTRIEQGLKNADAVEVKLKQATDAYDAKMRAARVEAQKIIEDTQRKSESLRAELLAKAQHEAERIFEAGKTTLEAERDRVMDEAEAELMDLVSQATERVLGEVVTPEIDKKLIEQAVKKVRIGRA